jgi:hypothetical protein
MENRWEWLHRLNTTQGLLIAVFGGPAVTGFVQAVLSALAHPNLPWWGYLCITALCSAIVVLVVARSNNRTGQSPLQQALAENLRLLTESDGLRSKLSDAESKISSMKPPPSFIVTDAVWGNDHHSEQVSDAINLMPRNAVAFFLNPDAFRPYTTPEKADPVAGPGKYLTVTASFPGKPSVTFRRAEGQIVVLPPDPLCFTENDFARDCKQFHYMIVPESKNFLNVFDSGYDSARNTINVIAKNQSDKELWIWAPVWENSTGDVESISPPSSGVLVDSSRLGLASNIWTGAGESAKAGAAQHVVFKTLVMPARGEGIPLRLKTKNAGTLLVPMKVEGGLRIERLRV